MARSDWPADPLPPEVVEAAIGLYRKHKSGPCGRKPDDRCELCERELASILTAALAHSAFAAWWAKRQGKRFVSGKQVMEHFIPNYQETCRYCGAVDPTAPRGATEGGHDGE